jgi:exoribonuclease-2
MIAEGFRPVFPPEVLADAAASAVPRLEGEDLTDLLWTSIDNSDSRDLDQVEYVERLADGGLRAMVGIAEVDASLRRGGPTDTHAAFNATSVYTGGPAFPMLPDVLSHDQTSLNPDGNRVAVVVEFVVTESGDVISENVRRAVLKNHAQLTYPQVARFYSGDKSVLPPVGGLVEQLELQRQACQRLIAFRNKRGSLSFGGVEHVPIVMNNQVKGIELVQQDAARDVIESLMVAANVCFARFLKAHGSMALRRVVREPKRWDRIQAIAQSYGTRLPGQPDSRRLNDFLARRKAADPLRYPELSLAVLKSLGPGEYIVETPGREKEGHFGLAVDDYGHSTAPNRRYADLAMQRLIKAVLTGEPSPYGEEELMELAAHCNDRESAARHVERFMKKVAAALLLGPRVNEVFDAVVTGVAPKGTFARLLKVPAEGRIVRGQSGLDVGDRIRARLSSVDANRGFIDLELVG